MTLWTAWIDYCATGEGRTICVMVGYAEDEAEAKTAFEKHFGEYFARGCEIEEGIKTDIVMLLFRRKVVESIARMDGQAGSMWIYGEMHYNLS